MGGGRGARTFSCMIVIVGEGGNSEHFKPLDGKISPRLKKRKSAKTKKADDWPKLHALAM